MKILNCKRRGIAPSESVQIAMSDQIVMTEMRTIRSIVANRVTLNHTIKIIERQQEQNNITHPQ